MLAQPDLPVFWRFLYCLLAGLLPAAATGATLPLWEAGAGAATMRLPDYRGADHSQVYSFPIPYLVYRGEKLKVDRQFIRGELFKSGRAQVELSFNGAPPVRSQDSGARAGMHSLPATGEIGPVLNLTLLEVPQHFKSVLELPLRAVVAADGGFHLHQAGYTFTPRLDLNLWHAAGRARWSTSFMFGPVFGDRRYNEFYYSVPAADAQPGRPAYAAPGGYAGTQAVLAATRRQGHWWMGAFVRVDGLAGARFTDSPLVRRRHNIAAGLAVSWIFATSRQTVTADD